METNYDDNGDYDDDIANNDDDDDVHDDDDDNDGGKTDARSINNVDLLISAFQFVTCWKDWKEWHFSIH